MKSDLPPPFWPDPTALGPLTDLYELTMMAGYRALGKHRQRATFELFVRRLPPNRAYLVFAGLEQAVGDLLRLAFSREQAEALRCWPAFAHVAPEFFDHLADLRFRGDLWAMPEGTIVFAGEPLVRVEADLDQAQWVETFLLAALGYPTLVASKAARIVDAAAGRPVCDFGARRAPGLHAGLIAARAAYLAGCTGTSHIEAARLLGIPCVGTMAHSWVQSFPTEAEAFAAFAAIFPGASTLLVDTYDVPEGVSVAAAIAPPIQAIRLDSGDLETLSRDARAYLDGHDRRSVQIVASGDLDEWAIERLVGAGAPIDVFGVGTEMVTSRDAPAISMVYKLVDLDGAGKIKLSAGKKTYPFAKQVVRSHGPGGRFSGDRVTRAVDAAEGEALLIPIVRAGELVSPLPGLNTIRLRCRDQRDALPPSLRLPDSAACYPVTYSAELEAWASRLGSRS